MRAIGVLAARSMLCGMADTAYVVDAVRSPIGRRNGSLSDIRADELAAQVLNGLIGRVDLDPGEIEDIADQAEQMSPSQLDSLDIGVEVAIDPLCRLKLQQIGIAKNSAERRPQLVTHVGQKAAFRSIRHLGGFFGLVERCFRLFALGQFLLNCGVELGVFARQGGKLLVLAAQRRGNVFALGDIAKHNNPAGQSAMPVV